MDKEIARHPVYTEEPIDIVMPDWVANSTVYVPRLKPEYRHSSKTPWTPSKKAKEEVEYRYKVFAEMEKQEKNNKKGK